MTRIALAPVVRRLASVATVLAALSHATPAPGQQPLPPGSRRLLDASLSGVVRLAATSQPVAAARVTLFTPGLGFFREARSAFDGRYAFDFVPSGVYRLGVASVDRAYQEVAAVLTPGPNVRDFTLQPETSIGSWSVIGDTLPELFDASDIGVLRPDGTILFCHDTVDPIVFDPVTGNKVMPTGSGSEQGCMNSTLMADGSVLLVGGQDGSSPGSFTNAIPWVKRFSLANTWTQQGDMLLTQGRWYAGLARLNDGRLLIMGGGTAPSAVRTDTCELYTDATQSWTFTDTMNSPLEFPPCALLYDGRVLRTWGASPELFDPRLGQWTQNVPFQFQDRGFPNHSDHSLIHLTDGRAVAIGVRQGAQTTRPMVEFFDPGSNSWSTGVNPTLSRMQAEVVYLPDGQILVAAGDAESHTGGEPNILGVVKRCDVFDPINGQWRRVGDMMHFREYHAVTLLVPDGRVLTTGGTQIKFQYGPTSADIEAWSPPYLFRGVRPVLSQLSSSTPTRGSTLSMRVFPETQLTSVVLMGLQSTTHWVDGGIPRRLEIVPAQSGSQAQFTLPSNADVLPVGWYMLFGMVDDIPSRALILRVDP